MLTAYLSIFQGIPSAILVLVTAAIISLILQKRSSVARSILFSFGFWLAPLFYITYMVLTHRATVAILTALFVEAFIFVVYQALFSSLLVMVGNRKLFDLRQLISWLKVGTAVVIALALPLFVVGNFGIFSDGARNEYLASSKWLVYLAYTSLLAQAVMVPIVAAILNRQRRWSNLIIFYLLLVSTLSLLAGSKGGGVLSIFAILSLLQFDDAKDYLRLFLFPVIAIILGLISTIYYLGKSLALDPLQMTTLLFMRVFMNNDARALAIDINGLQKLSLFRESFRSIASLLGNSPDNPALGQYLYAEAFHTSGFVGANTSGTALLIAYGGTNAKIVFAFLLCAIASIIYLLSRSWRHTSIVKLAIGLTLLSQLSQDFLAFQLLGNVLVLLAVLTVTSLFVRRILLIATTPGSTSGEDVHV